MKSHFVSSKQMSQKENLFVKGFHVLKLVCHLQKTEILLDQYKIKGEYSYIFLIKSPSAVITLHHNCKAEQFPEWGRTAQIAPHGITDTVHFSKLKSSACNYRIIECPELAGMGPTRIIESTPGSTHSITQNSNPMSESIV